MTTALIDKILGEKTLYGDLFPHDNIKIPLEYKRMCKLIHPDVCHDPRATDAFAKLQEFYNLASKALSSGMWEATNYVEFKTTTGKTLQLKYMYHGIFEIGEYFVCSKHIVYLFDFSKKKYYNNYINQIENLKYADGEMKKMFQPLFPTVIAEHDTVDNKHIIVVSKTEDVYPLRCVLDNFYKGDIPDTHLAWMVSRMMNIACYLKYNKQVHNGINIDNMFVSLQYHTILLIGGWWYAVDEDAKMIGTTKEIYSIMPPKVKADKNACSVTDVESVKAFGRKYLADSAPQAFKNFVNSGSKDDSMAEMEKWDDALIESFGKRKFIKIEATNKQIYNL
jgi:hypothetical protein